MDLTPEQEAELIEAFTEGESMAASLKTAMLPKAQRGRWRIAFEWQGGMVTQSLASKAQAKRTLRRLRQLGAKWAVFRRKRRNSNWMINVWRRYQAT